MINSQCGPTCRLVGLSRLGQTMRSTDSVKRLAVRVPLHSGAMHEARKNARVLPQLAPLLPLPIPVAVAVGSPGFGYPWHWLVCRWLDGEVATAEQFADSAETAAALADFLIALHSLNLEVTDQWRHEATRPPMSHRDAATRTAIDTVGGEFDAHALTAVWDAALAAEPARPTWVHGDFHSGNLLARDGQVTTVLDFGSFGYGDPATDFGIAFSLMSPSVRARFCLRLNVDEAAWTRCRGMAISGAVIVYASYAATQAHIAELTTRQIDQVLIRSRLPCYVSPLGDT